VLLGTEPRRRFSARWTAALLLIVVSPIVGIRLAEGHAALLWTEYYAAQGGLRRGADSAARAGKAASRAIDLSAPLPDAAEAARLSLDLGRSLEAQNPSSALEIFSEVRGALDRACASRLRRIGLAALDDEARSLEERARARLEGSRP
jgi:hypothetical protein